MKIYIAGASNEIERPEKWIAEAKKCGFEITLDWTVFVRQEGPKNDEGFTLELQAKYAEMDVRGVLDADIVWVLWPTTVSHGAAFEAGCAYMTAYWWGLILPKFAAEFPGSTDGLRAGPYTVCSGPKALTSIFTALIERDGFGKRFETDEEAFAHLLTLREPAVSIRVPHG